MNLFCISLDLHYTLNKISCASVMKINMNLFCISLDLHYLCSRIGPIVQWIEQVSPKD